MLPGLSSLGVFVHSTCLICTIQPHEVPVTQWGSQELIGMNSQTVQEPYLMLLFEPRGNIKLLTDECLWWMVFI